MWNYRVVRKKNTWIDPVGKKERIDYSYAIHEAYYDRNGYVGAVTQEPVEPFGENIEELRHSWVMMAESFGQPILDYDNIPEPGYDRKEDIMGSVLDKRLEEHEASGIGESGVPLKDVKRELEEKWGPFDHEGYRKQVEEERVEKEKTHSELFIGTPTTKELIDKMHSDHREWIEKERTENLGKHSPKDA